MSGILWRDRKIDAALFDFDGTLVTLEIDFPLMRRRVEAVIERYGIEWDSLTGEFSLERIEEARAILEARDPAQAAQMAKEAIAEIEAMEEAAAERARLAEGAMELFAAFKRARVKAGIVTRNSRKAVETVLSREPLSAEVIVSRDETPYLKPDPRHLLLALESLRVPPERALMVGDHASDMRAARSAAIMPIGILNGFNQSSPLVGAGAVAVVKNLRELAGLLGL